MDVIVLKKIDEKEFELLLELLNKIKLKKKLDWEEGKRTNNSYRYNFPSHRSEIFGLIKLRTPDAMRKGYNYARSSSSKKRPDIYNELKRIGDLIVSLTRHHGVSSYTSILVNHNTICGKHKDANNIGKSLLISIGDYTGCNIVIENKTYDAKYTPIIFNGSELTHWNNPDLQGNKYSLVYYSLI